MAVFLATYDLNREAVRPHITKIIHDNWAWAKLSESSYAVEAESADEVWSLLMPLLDGNDNLFIFALKHPYQGWGAQEVHDWLETRLTY